MSVDLLSSHLTSDDDDDTSKYLMTFCMELVHHSQWKSQRTFMCGSSLEIGNQFYIVNRLIIITGRLSTVDIDEMISSSSRCAVQRCKRVPETYTGDIIRIYTDDVHPGYVRLIREKDNEELQCLSNMFPLNSNQTKHGPAVLRDSRKYSKEIKYSLSNDSIDEFVCNRFMAPFHDTVYPVHSPYWPVEAAEWITRRRTHGFPSKSVIKQVVRYGCDFVQVSHNKHSNDREWRFSFSKAELILVKSWTISQRIVYSSLWILNKKIASSNLCTYYFKTLMFWACEEKTPQFWRDNLLIHSVCELLIEMMKWVKLKFSVNYFIPGNNMMDHLIDTDLSHEIDALWRTSQSRQLIAEVIEVCREEILRFTDAIYQIKLPAYILRAYLIYWRVKNDIDSYRDLFNTDLAADLQNALYAELSDIYRGLRSQQMSVRCVNELDRFIYSLTSEGRLLLAVELCESFQKVVFSSCSREFIQSITKAFIVTNIDESSREKNDSGELNLKGRSTADRQKSLNYRNQQKCVLYSRSAEKNKNKLVHNYYRREMKPISEGRIVNIALDFVSKIKTSFDDNVRFYKEWPGRSPTVNISWFIAKAYLANLYYTTQHDVSLTIKTCDDIIDVYRQSLMNQRFAERTFPVLLSTQWTSIYDKEIQELLGFYSLCSYVFDASSRSVYLGVCPVQFALYLKLRVLYKLACNLCTVGDDIFSVRDINKCVDDYNEHHLACKCNGKVIDGAITLETALYVSQTISKYPCPRDAAGLSFVRDEAVSDDYVEHWNNYV